MSRILYALTLLVMSLLGQSITAQVLFTEDFADDFPDDWISRVVEGNGQRSSAWLHTETGPSGPIGGDGLASPTAANGWMIFDSDLNCYNGFSQDAWLISPPIAAGSAATAFLSFATYYQSYNDRPQIRIGSDLSELDSWITLEAFPDIAANEFGGPDPLGNINPVNMYFDLSQWLAGRSDQRIAFQFLSNINTLNGTADDIACAYSWQIDDVAITVEDPRPTFDMGISRFASIAPNAQTPLCQVEPIHFLADITNYGRETPDSTVLRLTIRTNLGQTVFTDQLVYGPITPDSTAENVFFRQSFLPPMEPNIYTGTYSLEYPGMEEDGFLANNTSSFLFRISDSLYSKDLGATRSIAPESNPSYSYGNVFFVLHGDGKTIQEVSFAVANAEELIGRQVTVFVAAWDGTHRDPRFVSPDEYETVGLADYTFQGNESIGRISVDVRTIVNDQPVTLQDSTYYMVGIEYNSTDEITLELLASDEYDYSATVFQTDSLDMPRYNSILNVVGVDAVGEYDLLGFGHDVVPTIRMRTSACEVVSTNEPSHHPTLVRVYPNPTHGQIMARLLPASKGPIELRLYSLQGKLIWVQTADSARQPQLPLDLTDLSAGSYLLEVRGDQGRQSLLVVKQ